VQHLIISADDYGYAPAYDRGILEAARAEAIDSASVMVGMVGPAAVASLLATNVEIGLHVAIPLAFRALTAAQVREHLEMELTSFERVFERPPAFLDGHHHCHAGHGVAATIGRLAAERDLPVRSVNPAHRRLLRGLGVATPDLLVGRIKQTEPAVPPEIQALLVGDQVPDGVVEWMTHPGHPDPDSGSSYDSGRLQDLRLLMDLREELPLRRLRASHALALGL
jgi:predicted glycoside hydrolase/deacetylase ChbG (UPF0249 family)